MSREEPLLVIRNLSKRFGAVQALKRVNLKVYRREILGLVGDNGAGKSTLVKVLVGVYPPDEGEIYFEGKRVQFSSPLEARMAGIEIVYQDLALIDSMNVVRNFFLGRELCKKGIGLMKMLDLNRMDKECMEAISRLRILGVDSPRRSVITLSGGQRQSVAMARALYFGAKLLILDEPTAFLSVRETRMVGEIIKRAREMGLSVIFISHNIWHVHSVVDRFVILERGVKLGSFYKKDVTPEDIADIIATGEIPPRLQKLKLPD